MSETKTAHRLDILRTYFRDIEEGETKEAALELLKMVDLKEAENKKIIEDCRDSIGEKQEEINKLISGNKELEEAIEGITSMAEDMRDKTGDLLTELVGKEKADELTGVRRGQ